VFLAARRTRRAAKNIKRKSSSPACATSSNFLRKISSTNSRRPQCPIHRNRVRPLPISLKSVFGCTLYSACSQKHKKKILFACLHNPFRFPATNSRRPQCLIHRNRVRPLPISLKSVFGCTPYSACSQKHKKKILFVCLHNLFRFSPENFPLQILAGRGMINPRRGRQGDAYFLLPTSTQKSGVF